MTLWHIRMLVLKVKEKWIVSGGNCSNEIKKRYKNNIWIHVTVSLLLTYIL